MITISATVRVDLGPLAEFKAHFEGDLRHAGNGPVRKAFKQWAARYRSFIQERFVLFSRGGGDWPPLKHPRRRGNKDKAAILRDTGTLFAALSPTFQKKPGALQEDIDFGIRIGYGGPGRYANGGAATVADIAGFHQVGAGFLPVRKIIVEPSVNVLEQMAGDMNRALGTLLKDTKND